MSARVSGVMIFSFREKKFYYTVNTRCSNEFQIRCKSVMRFKSLIEHLRFYSTFGGGWRFGAHTHPSSFAHISKIIL